eukprot:8420692-Alexandrium_andersonii.AAC.1
MERFFGRGGMSTCVATQCLRCAELLTLRLALPVGSGGSVEADPWACRTPVRQTPRHAGPPRPFLVRIGTL